MKIVKAIRRGWIVPKQNVPSKPAVYDLWGSNDVAPTEDRMHIPAPKLRLPGNQLN